MNGLANTYWGYGGVFIADKTGVYGDWGVGGPSFQGFTGFGPIDLTDNVMLVVIAGGNPDGDVYIDDITINEILYDLEPPPPLIEVDIDIKPGSDPNSINLKSKGVVPVAVLTAGEFDAATVDPETVEFADASPVRWVMCDVDDDDDLDMLFHFKTQDLDLTEDSTEATLTGKTTDGTDIIGTDTVNIVPKGKGPK